MNANLKSWAEAEKMILRAPVSASRSIAIGVANDVVWRLLTDVPRWRQWYGYLKNAWLDGPFVRGTALPYGGFFKHPLRLAKVEPGKLTMLYGTMAGYTGITRWEVKAWRGSFVAVKYATLEWVDWFSHRRLLELIGNIPPAEAEKLFYAAAQTRSIWRRDSQPNASNKPGAVDCPTMVSFQE